jgi:hypothetical protein
MKKIFLFTASILGSIVLLTACNSGQSTTNSDTSKVITSDTSKTTANTTTRVNAKKSTTFLDSCKTNIIGTWISKDNPEGNMTFTKDSCYQVNNGKVFEKDVYVISLVSPPCGVTKSEGPHDVYLTLTNTENKNNTCMEILDLTKTHYTYRAMEATNDVEFEYDKKQ